MTFSSVTVSTDSEFFSLRDFYIVSANFFNWTITYIHYIMIRKTNFFSFTIWIQFDLNPIIDTSYLKWRHIFTIERIKRYHWFDTNFVVTLVGNFGGQIDPCWIKCFYEFETFKVPVDIAREGSSFEWKGTCILTLREPDPALVRKKLITLKKVHNKCDWIHHKF